MSVPTYVCLSVGFFQLFFLDRKFSKTILVLSTKIAIFLNVLLLSLLSLFFPKTPSTKVTIVFSHLHVLNSNAKNKRKKSDEKILFFQVVFGVDSVLFTKNLYQDLFKLFVCLSCCQLRNE